jgi:two-component system, cell cycle response regulator
MSLRVLLADESDTIKKVFQLALQDMNVEVKTVQSGLDVMNVAQSFQPQIIFADVLLQKKNGYEMCLEIKQDSQLARIPVVLMWSSFMELDQEQFKKSRAEDQLEKPFDADLLRSLVQKHIPDIATSPLSAFLKFPKSSAKEKTSAKAAPPSPLSVVEKPIKEDTSEFNLNSILGDLTSASIKLKNETPPSFSDFNEEVIEMPSLDTPAPSEFEQFKIDQPVDNLEKFEALNLSSHDSSASQETPPANPTENEGLMNDLDNIQPMQLDNLFKSEPTKTAAKPALDARIKEKMATSKAETAFSTTKGLDNQEIEAIVRAHTEEFIKNQLQDSLLAIVEKIVRQELTKVLDEEVRLKQELHDDNP